MRIVLGLGFDGGAWPGALRASGRRAAFDEAWVGPLGLLKILETATGLVGPDDGASERAAALVPVLRATPGAWTRSLDADPLAVARAVLRTRDVLVEAGLDVARAFGPDGAALGARLRDVLAVTASVRPGVADRLAAVARAIDEGADAAVDELVVVDPRDALAPVHRRLLDALARRGVRVVDAPDVEAAAEGDLGASRSSTFVPRGDGSLVLVRGDCPEETAIEIAAHISRLPSLDDVVIVRPDAVLDGALARMGLPTMGARGERGDDGLLQVAPLVVALAWPERDPERAFELLSLSTSPIRRRVSRPLAVALTREPAVGSDRWRTMLDEAVAALDEEHRPAARERVARVFGDVGADPGPGADALARKLLDERLALLRGWLHGRAQRTQTVHDQLELKGALAQVAAIGGMARALGAETLSRADVMRIVEQATRAARPRTPRPPLAGLSRVNDPAAIAGPVAHVVWWGFSRESEPVPRALALSVEERASLASLGVTLAAPAAVAEHRALAYGRPHRAATTSLVLGCPRRDTAGEEIHPHPLWDEIAARAGAQASLLERRRMFKPGELPSTRYKAREEPEAQREWRFPAGSVKRGEVEYPSTREALLGCTFRGVVERVGVKDRARRLPDGAQLFGDLAHDVLARVLAQRPATPDAAAEAARRIFDERMPRRAARYLRPAERSHRGRARETIALAAFDVVERLASRGFTVRDVEKEIEKGPEGRLVKGRPDLVVEGPGGFPVVVIDFKSGDDAGKLRALEGGTAVQLVAYAQLVRESASQPWPGIAFYQVRSRKLLTTCKELGGHETIESPHAVDDISVRLKKAGKEADDAIEAGRAEARGVGVPLHQLRSRVEGNDIVIAPQCTFCSFGFLCGRAIAGVER
jgi:hypothetical protein